MTTYQPWRPTIDARQADSELPQATIPYDLLPGGEFALSQISLTGFLLGISSGVAIGLSVYFHVTDSAYFQTSLFLLFLSVFHFLEFYITARYNTARADADAYLLTNNGWQYTAAHSAAFLESIVETHFFPSLKSHTKLVLFGFLLIIIGQIFRSVAMSTCGTNFSHLIARQKARDHQLVKHGIYAYLRHPSYTGFYWWAMGSQIMLGNPICALGFAVVLVRFFGRRIEREEELLVDFFGQDYVEYRKKTWILIPGVGL